MEKRQQTAGGLSPVSREGRIRLEVATGRSSLMLKHHDQTHIQRSLTWRIPQAVLLLGLSAIIGIGGSRVGAWDDASQANPGLQGLLPEETPDDLGFESWERLDGNWASWSEDVAGLVGQLYEDELNLKQQQELLGSLRKKLAVMQTALNDARYASLHVPLASLHSRLARRVALATAMLETVSLKPAELRTAALKDSGKQLLSALTDLETDLNAIPNGRAWFGYVKLSTLKSIATDGKSDDESQGVLTSVRKRLESTDSLNDEQKTFVSRATFQSLAASIKAYQSVLSESYEEADPQALRAQLKALAAALETYEQSDGRQAAQQAHAALTALKTVAPDKGHRVAKVVDQMYTNYNLRLIASEGFLNRVVRTERQESGDVKDFILGANVSGTQKTTAYIGIDLKNSNDGALFDITLKGTVRSNTQGVTDKATIYTSGRHEFLAIKPVHFDGQTLSGKKSTITGDANNTTTGARTQASGIPLFGQIANGIARNVARQRRAESEAITESRVSAQVLPRFNTEVDRDLAKANQALKDDVIAKLTKAKMYPSRQQLLSTDTQFQLNSRIMDADELGGTGAQSAPVSKNNMALQLHESLVNNALNHLKLAGRTMSEEELKAEFERGLSSFTGRQVSLSDETSADAEPDTDSGPNTFVFDAHDPIRIQFADGEVVLILRAGFRQEGKDDIPPQQVSVPLKFAVDGNQIVATRGTVKVSPVVRPKNLQIQIARAGVIRKKLERALPERRFERKLTVERKNDPSLVIGLTRINSLDGWLTLTAE